MKNLEKYKGVFPAFYACYDANGKINPEAIESLAKHYLDKGVTGLYVGGSSGECIYQSIEERQIVLEHVVKAVGDKMVIIAHVGAPSTRDSIILAKHAASLNVDALSAIPPIYYAMSHESVREYWLGIVNATDLDFIIYNIPQTTGYSLSLESYLEMLKHDQVIGVKNSSMAVLDIHMFKYYAPKDVVVFNGPDEQFLGGRISGADSGIGGTYGVMPELFIEMHKAINNHDIKRAQKIQIDVEKIIRDILSCDGNLYAIIKKILEKDNIFCGGVRSPLKNISHDDILRINDIHLSIQKAKNKYLD